MAREDQPAGAMGERVLHMIVEEPVEVLEHPEHGPGERRAVLGANHKLSDAEGSKGRNDTQDVDGHRQQGYGKN